MKDVIFLPWVGKYYSEKGYKKKKIMVLGESHYCNRCDYCEASKNNKCKEREEHINLFLKYLNGNEKFMPWFNTYIKFTNILIGKECKNETKINFWNSILFYNYVQTPIKEGPGTRPTKKMFKDSEKAFFQIIKKYNPDLIIVWGNWLWKNLPDENFSDGKIIMGKSSGLYNNGKRSIPTFFIIHPRRLEYNYWEKYIEKAVFELIKIKL